jgi:hypothetical protein
MTKRPKIDLSRPQDAVSLKQKIDFSLAVLRAQEECALSRKPVDIWGEPIWLDCEKYPHASPTWATEFAVAERQKARLRRKFLRDE